MSFLSTIFGGPSSQEQAIASQNQTLASNLAADFNENFGAQSSVLQNLNSQLTPIANAGINQQGFSPQELAAMNTQAINNAGAAARNAQQSTASKLAGQETVPGFGGNSSGLESGIEQQIQGTIASSAANQLSNAENAITQQNYATGRQNFLAATGGEEALAKAYDPTALAGEAGSIGNAAFGEANTVNSQKGSVLGDIGALGAIGGKALLGGLSGGISNVLSGGTQAGTTTGGGLEQFLSGAFNYNPK